MEVEEQLEFTLRFPSGMLASCSTSYGYHDSKRYRLLGTEAWADLDPAFSYTGQALRIGRKRDGADMNEVSQRILDAKNQFALEMDHLAACVQSGIRPHTPGEEGLQDMRIIAALYEAAHSGRVVKLPSFTTPDPFRGPPPT